jgi:hypothetical protein
MGSKKGRMRVREMKKEDTHKFQEKYAPAFSLRFV